MHGMIYTSFRTVISCGEGKERCLVIRIVKRRGLRRMWENNILFIGVEGQGWGIIHGCLLYNFLNA